MQTKDITGERFGLLTAISPLPPRNGKRSRLWRCLCECGEYCERTQNALHTGHAKSCGHLRGKAAPRRDAEVLAALDQFTVGATIPELIMLTGVSWSTVDAVLTRLHGRGQVHIVGWKSKGPGIDAERPERLTIAERARRFRAKPVAIENAKAADPSLGVWAGLVQEK
jgi:hypothetical protein